jgi:hypothetical protein
MDGFITESLSKITDGFGNSVKLIVIYALTTLLAIPIWNYFNRAGLLIYIIILLAIGGYELQRSLLPRVSEPRRAWHGMAAGLIFWQSIRFITELTSTQMFQGAGVLFWLLAVIITAVLWKRILPISMQSAMLTLLVCWLEKIYQQGFSILTSWPPVISFAYQLQRWVAVGIGILCLLLIIFRSYGLNKRVYCAVLIFGAFLFLLLVF